LVNTSNVVRLGQREEMTDRIEEKSNGVGELSDAYFVGEGEKIGIANVEGSTYDLRSRKIGVILPGTEEFLHYTWSQYFDEVVPLIVDKFNKKIDGAAFLGLHGNVFGSNILQAATDAGNTVEGGLTTDAIYDIQDMTDNAPNAFVGNRVLNRTLRTLTDGGVELADG
ncbi:phage major capsid protein, partial [Salmonella enterica subsp. enterica serovar Enteritidis]